MILKFNLNLFGSLVILNISRISHGGYGKLVYCLITSLLDYYLTLNNYFNIWQAY